MPADLAGSSACDILGRAKHIYHPDLPCDELCWLGLSRALCDQPRRLYSVGSCFYPSIALPPSALHWRAASARFWASPNMLGATSATPFPSFLRPRSRRRQTRPDTSIIVLVSVARCRIVILGTDSSQTHCWREMDSNFRFHAIGFVSKLCRLSADLSCGEDALSRLGTDFAARLPRFSEPRPSWADRSSRRVSRAVAGHPPIGVVRGHSRSRR